MKYFILLIALPVSADIHKCIDQEGAVTYRDMPCSRQERRENIDRNHTNDLPVAPPLEEQKAMEQLSDARKKERAEHVRRRNRAIREYSRQHEQRKARCAKLKEDYRAWERIKRRDGKPGNNQGSKLMRKMRRACSGWSGH